ncbi:hypothetical protein B0H13DRAFT_1912631 [Mycena leptocephala]|nr:hypothetical protein B0H13DRAFT_1912631 [Mycena leptocephala]
MATVPRRQSRVNLFALLSNYLRAALRKLNATLDEHDGATVRTSKPTGGRTCRAAPAYKTPRHNSAPPGPASAPTGAPTEVQCNGFWPNLPPKIFVFALTAINVVACRKDEQIYFQLEGGDTQCARTTLALERHVDIARTPSHHPALLSPHRKRLGRGSAHGPQRTITGSLFVPWSRHRRGQRRPKSKMRSSARRRAVCLMKKTLSWP